MSGLKKLCESIFNDLELRFPKQRLTQRRKLSELVSAMLMCQTPNLMELSNVLDRPCDSVEARYNYVERFLKNDLVSHEEVMRNYSQELLLRLSEFQDRLFLMIDQSKINDDLELLMISVRVGKRALPIFWICKETRGAIGFKEQKVILETVKSWMPDNVNVLLAGDRFYGSKKLIEWCQNNNWQYRLRLKGNFIINQGNNSGKTLNQLELENIKYIEKANMKVGITTDIGILYEKGHKEPWFIAMDSKPTKLKILDYTKRWGIENMFSDFKSRGFSLMNSKIKFADRLQRLIMIASIAFHWAVSVGMFKKNSKISIKNQDPVYQFLNVVYVNSHNILHWIKGHRLYGFF